MKHWKEGFFFLPAMAVLLAAVVGFQSNVPSFDDIVYPEPKKEETTTNPEPQQEENTPDAQTVEEHEEKAQKDGEKRKAEPKEMSAHPNDSRWKDGTYTGSGKGYGGTITVSVTIEKGKISSIQVTSHKGETEAFFNKGKGIIERIVSSQSTDVDTVSGATYSSGGIREAVMQALRKAGDTSLPKNDKKTSDKDASKTKTDKQKAAKKKTSQKKDSPKNTDNKEKPADGTYSGSAVCERFNYVVHIKTKFQKGKAVSISDLQLTNNNHAVNENFCKKAWKPMVNRILKKQGTDVDAVTGATYSSNAIKKAYQDTYTQAVQAAKKNNSEGKPTAMPVPAETSDMPQQTPPESTQTPTEIVQPEENMPEQNESTLGTVQDGTYTVTGTVTATPWSFFTDYTLTGEFQFSDGRLISIENLKPSDPHNLDFCNMALIKMYEDAVLMAGKAERRHRKLCGHLS